MNEIRELKLTKGYWYLATPYSKWKGGLDDAAFIAAKVAGRLIRAGVHVFSPIAHSHHISVAAEIDLRSYEIWLSLDKPLFEAAYGILVADLDGWDESYGITQELKWAREHGKPRYLVHPELLTWEVIL